MLQSAAASVGGGPPRGASDGMTAQALRRTLHSDPNKFPQDVVELKRYLDDPQENQQIFAVPGYGANVPMYILGSSLFGAQLAAILGLPFAFASHFAPQAMMQALEIYRAEFQASEQLSEPHVILGYNICAADTQEHAEFIRSSSLQAFINLRFGNPGPLPPPVANFEETLNSQQHAVLAQVSSASSVGTKDAVREDVAKFVAETGADELIIVAQVYHQQDRLRSYELAWEALN